MARSYRYVLDSGEVYRMTERNYRRFLKAGLERSVELEDYGVFVHCIDFHLTDGTVNDFQERIAVDYPEGL
jgi:hypothetical protein